MTVKCATCARAQRTFLCRYGSREHDGIVPGSRVLRCTRRNYDDNLRETEGA